MDITGATMCAEFEAMLQSDSSFDYDQYLVDNWAIVVADTEVAVAWENEFAQFAQYADRLFERYCPSTRAAALGLPAS